MKWLRKLKSCYTYVYIFLFSLNSTLEIPLNNWIVLVHYFWYPHNFPWYGYSIIFLSLPFDSIYFVLPLCSSFFFFKVKLSAATNNLICIYSYEYFYFTGISIPKVGLFVQMVSSFKTTARLLSKESLFPQILNESTFFSISGLSRCYQFLILLVL